ncbi:hypothetical protein COUCH_26640 [Couchioplanes caeruleus]|uniref:hypothetical protein n=1 Tax=Couchioplanes caeruleus TaxID=56438 RepID=UPI0020BF5AA7|nr:hypothetical protein [Couchioplanes caeruleus]UQU62593.1 hypothetical protein COUCH_26640 [Couchioplanes caeruleus]
MLRARVYGALLTLLAGLVGVLFALPASWSDYPDRYPDFRLGRVWMTPYPSTLPVLITMLGVAGLVAAVRPSTARVAAVTAGLAALQVGGIAVVAHRDWWNLAGADGASPHRAAAGSLVSLVMGAAAGAAVVVSVLLYRTGRSVHRPSLIQVVGGVLAGAVLAGGTPLLLCAYWGYTSITAAGQFAVWWSLPWGAGVAATGTLPDCAARRTAALCVLACALLTAFCVAAPPVHGFGVRLPD